LGRTDSGIEYDLRTRTSREEWCLGYTQGDALRLPKLNKGTLATTEEGHYLLERNKKRVLAEGGRGRTGKDMITRI